MLLLAFVFCGFLCFALGWLAGAKIAGRYLAGQLIDAARKAGADPRIFIKEIDFIEASYEDFLRND